ncbi:M23 family metallopeptidase [Qipengyuania sp. CAU 1752]
MVRTVLIALFFSAAGSPALLAEDDVLPATDAAETVIVEPPEPAVVLTVSRASDLDGQSGALVRIVNTRPATTTGKGGAGIVGGAPAGSPLATSRVSSNFGYRVNPVTGQWRRHAGIDLAASHGTPVVATAAGVVTLAGYAGNYGNLVIVRHGSGVETRYAHLSRIAVGRGSAISRGQVIGYVGSTGRSTGPHLHYEIRRHGNAQNPAGSMGR